MLGFVCFCELYTLGLMNCFNHRSNIEQMKRVEKEGGWESGGGDGGGSGRVGAEGRQLKSTQPKNLNMDLAMKRRM